MTTVEIRVENTWEGRKPRHGAQFVVTLDLLAEALGLPEGARVVSVTGSVIQQTIERTVSVMVEHGDLPKVGEGAIPVEISPAFDEDGKLTDWGVT